MSLKPPFLKPPFPQPSPARRSAVRRVLFLAFLLPAPASPLAAGSFLRADANLDGALDLADPISSLAFLFAGGAPLGCPDAADADDSGSLDIADPINTLGYLFQGGPPPGSPFPHPGSDPTPDELACRGEPDVDEGLAMAGMPEDAPDLALAGGPPAAPPVVELQGDALAVSPETFSALAALPPGVPLREALGEETDRFLEAFFGGRPPHPDGPTALAVDAVLPMGADGCARVPPELIDGGSHDADPPGSFRRGDVDGDGELRVEDALLLEACVRGTAPCDLGCWDAADADDDGQLGLGDVESIALALLGEVRLPAPGPACGPDPTPDRLPPCSARCGSSRQGLVLAVEPAVICGEGPHLVEIIVIDLDGLSSRASSLVTLCPLDGPDCPPGGRSEPLAGDDLPGPPPRCRWITAQIHEPEEPESDLHQRTFDGNGNVRETRTRPPLISSSGGGMEVWRTDLGKGPNHFLAASRTGASCRTPPTELALTRTGMVQLRLNLLCLRGDGTPIECSSEAEVEGTYRSRSEAGTSAGPACGMKPNRVEALAQDEVSFQANGTSLFAKGMAVQNGNAVRSGPSFTLDLGIARGPAGVSANPSFRFGYSLTTSDQTGKDEDTIDAFGNAKVDLPLTLSLTAKGKVDIQAYHRTWARTSTRMLLAGYWLVARTPCPAPPLFLSEIAGEDHERALAERMALDFRRTRLGY